MGGAYDQCVDDWFKGTKLYKKHLDSYVKKEGMLPSTKAGILTIVTILKELSAKGRMKRFGL